MYPLNSFSKIHNFFSHRFNATLLIFFGANLILFSIFSLLIFKKNLDYLFYGFDGHYLSMLINKQILSGEKTLGLGINILQSLGNISYPTNFWIIPAISLAQFFSAKGIDSILLYTFFSLELFIAALILGRFAGLNWYSTFVFGWILPLLIMPYYGLPYFYHITSLAPQVLDSIVISTILILIFSKIGKIEFFYSIILFILICVGIVYLFITYTVSAILLIPIFSIFSFFFFIHSRDKNEIIYKILSVIGLILIIYYLGLFSYLKGLLEYTAANFFTHELYMDRPPWFFTSILFHNNISSIILVCSLVGGILDSFDKFANRKILARSFIFTVLTIFIFGILINNFAFNTSISLLYFEFYLWPFYILFFISFSIRMVNYVFSNIIYVVNYSLLKLLIFFIPWILVAIPSAPKPTELVPINPQKTPILKILSDEISFSSGNRFNGRVATFTGLSFPGNLDWAKLGYLDYQLRNKYGTEHRSISLWFNNIPTLWEYNSLITPIFYIFTKNFLSKPEDFQTRNVMVWRKIDPKILSLIGVKFIVTDEIIDGFRQRAVVQMGDLGTHYLYEIKDPNLGNYSPVNQINLSQLNEILSELSKHSFDPTYSFITSTKLPTQLTPATNISITMNQQHIDISAQSQSTSVLILPFEFSNCLELISKDSALKINTFRVNALLIGVVFTKRLEASLIFNNSPFGADNCRQLDAKEFKEMTYPHYQIINSTN